MKAWDVIIVGSGPAGSALACRLRPQYRVLLLERAATCAHEQPRIGESLPGASRVLLERLGGFERFLADHHAERGATLSAWDRDEPVWFDHLRDPNGPGWHLDRRRFDACLRGTAVAAGAVLMEDCGRLRVSYSEEGWRIDLDDHAQTHCAPVLVDASGRNATVSRQLGLVRHGEDKLICLHAYLSGNVDDEDHCTRICADRNGWWYSVRVPAGDRVLAFHLDNDDQDMKRLREPSHFIAKARAHPLLAEVLKGTVPEEIQARPAGSAALDLDAMSRAGSGFFAIGDAVLSFDPVASQGIFHAMASADSAARAIQGQLAHDPSAREDFLAEMRNVQARYRLHLDQTYAGVTRLQNETFWSRRMDGK